MLRVGGLYKLNNGSVVKAVEEADWGSAVIVVYIRGTYSRDFYRTMQKQRPGPCRPEHEVAKEIAP